MEKIFKAYMNLYTNNLGISILYKNLEKIYFKIINGNKILNKY